MASVYWIHDNGGRPFQVVIRDKSVKIYKQESESEEYEKDALFEFPNVEKIWIGKSPKTKRTLFSGGFGRSFDGNSILVQLTKDNRYVFIGERVYEFGSEFKIVAFVSPVGNSDVPYPYATDKNRNI